MADKEQYDDLETDYLEEESESGLLSLMSLVIGFVAVAGFIALAWYAYRSSTEPMLNEDLEVVTAEESPVRTAPEEPGGWQFPHQEKSVYNVISGEEDKTKAEQILPKEEEPMQRADETTAPDTADAEASTETWVNERDGSAAQTEAADAETAAVEEKEAPAVTSGSAVNVGDAPVATEAKPAVTKPAEEKVVTKTETPGKAKPAPESVVAAKPADAFKAQPEQAPKPVAKTEAIPEPKLAPASGGPTPVRLQLGAYGSQAEANASWAKIQKKVGGSVNGYRTTIEQADVSGKSFYRLQLYPFASMDEAKSLCSQLSAKGQPCFPVKR
jgi:cell division septation protein DedD